MTNDKNKTIIRILIFLIFSFVPVYIIGIFGVSKDLEMLTASGTATIMYYPALANIITRLITKEGFSDSKLKINFRGNEKYYLFSLLYCIIAGIMIGLICILFFVDSYSFSDAVKQNGGAKNITAILLSCIYSGLLALLNGFGEEFGWRAYLTPKLEKLMPKSAAVILCGIIWGLWHAPLIVKGYDFGRDYKFFPYLGVIMMCLGCIFISYILTWLTRKTNSVYPAAITHILIDSVMSSIAIILIGQENAAKINGFTIGIISIVIVPFVISMVIFFSDLIKDKTK